MAISFYHLLPRDEGQGEARQQLSPLPALAWHRGQVRDFLCCPRLGPWKAKSGVDVQL